MLGAGDLAAAKAGAELEALGGGDAEHGVRQAGLELVEAGLAQAAGDVADDAGHGSANAVLPVPEVGDALLHPPRGVLVGASHGQELVDGLAVNGLNELEELGILAGRGRLGGGREHVDGADGCREGSDLNAVGNLQVLFGNGTSSDTANGLAR